MSDAPPPPDPQDAGSPAWPHVRRKRYPGRYPRRYSDRYKELQPERYPETVAKVRASGKTPAGQHIPILLAEILEALAPKPGDRAVDCTLGYGGHAAAILEAIQPGGVLLGLDRDPLGIAGTEARLRATGIPESALIVRKSNFAGIRRALADAGWTDGADVILADPGVSSMQLDNPERGFTFKAAGPLDMRMNPTHGQSARDLIRKSSAERLAAIFREHSEIDDADRVAAAIAGRDFPGTLDLAKAVRAALPGRPGPDAEALAVRLVFQALRMEVNDEAGSLEALLRDLPWCLRPGGRVAILTFHSGEDRRVKKAFQAGLEAGHYREITRDVIRPTAREIHDNPRARSAKLRVAIRAEAAD